MQNIQTKRIGRVMRRSRLYGLKVTGSVRLEATHLSP